jgi:3' terminal RNA ribose 2'-O-methyltransferase Hen1
MILTITTTYQPATDLGYLLFKHPERVQSIELTFGKAHIFFPQVSQERCTAALLLDIDPIGLVRKRRGPSGNSFALDQYVNDRPYVASSFMSVALLEAFRSAMKGDSAGRSGLARTPIPLQATVSAVPCHGGEELLQRLFQPLGYKVTVVRHPLDDHFVEWGESPYYTLTISSTVQLSDMLKHLYVLIPVMDNDKHYWVGDDEIEKLLNKGKGWIEDHPEKQLIVDRYLKHRRSLVNVAMSRLADEDNLDPDAAEQRHAEEESAAEDALSLQQQRMGSVLAVLKASGARSVMDLGCGEGQLLGMLMKDHSFTRLIGVDVSHRMLEIAHDRLRLDRLSEKECERLSLLQGSLIYRDGRLSAFDAAAVVEVIEHLEPSRLELFQRVLFEFARPGTVVITTPNAEYNVMWPSLPAGKFRHRDHRFEWTRQQFREWAARVCSMFSYDVRFLSVGPEDEKLGPPTQMAIFTLKDGISGGPQT